jgi:ABC-2 type transport system permease protein
MNLFSMKLLNIAYEEMWVHLKKWSFYLTAFGMPLVFAAISFFPQLRTAAESTPLGSVETVFSPAENLVKPTGYVDEAGVIQFIPAEQAENLLPFDSEQAAAGALKAGHIESYYVIPTDYPDTGKLTQYSTDPQLFNGADTVIRGILRQNLLRTIGDADLVARFEDAVQFDRGGRPEPPAFSFIPAELDRRRLTVAGLLIGLFTYVINVGGMYLVRALRQETKARVLEVLITSTTPFEFVGGKLLGLTILVLGQAVIAILIGGLAYNRGTGDSDTLSISTLLLSLPYLLLGYLAYSGGILCLTAIWPNLPESSTLLAMTRLLALSPIIGVVFILPRADGLAAISLTILPQTSPLLMPFRLLLTDVPAWQYLLGLIGLLLWTAGSIWLSVRLFRANRLLIGQTGNPAALWQALRG